MPVLVIEDAGRSNSRQTTRRNAATALNAAATVAGPLGPVLRVGAAILGLGGRGSSRTGPTISIDSATGKAIVTDARPDETARITQLVEEAFRTGAQPTGERWHRTWTPFIQQAADFGRDVRLGRYPEDAAPDEPEPPDDGGPSFGGDRLPIEGGRQLSPIGEEDFFMPSFMRSIPGGGAGFAQQTPAGQRQMGATMGGGGRRKKKATRSRKARSGGGARRVKRRATSRARSSGRTAKFVKGSPAAKRHMARLRAMRKRKRG